MNKLELTKTAAKLITGCSASFVVGNVIKNNTTPKNLIQKIEVVVGAAVIGGIAAKQAERYTDAFIDDVVKGWNKAKTDSNSK